MFDRERAISNWREEMSARDLSDAVVDELESHLRDELEAQVRAGVGSEDAFTTAVQRVGRADVLKTEFAKSFTLFDRLKDAMLTLAGIPSSNLATNMNTSQTEPAWATYLKALGFLVPAIFLATVAAIFVVPKLQEICRDVQMPEATAGTFWNLTHSSILVMLTLREHGMLIAGGLVCVVLLLEWRLTQWPRYRRAAIGFGAFLLNSIVLLAFFMMFLAAIMAAPGLRLPK